jgi:hypothetical protein
MLADNRRTCSGRIKLKAHLHKSTSRVYRRNHGRSIRTVRPPHFHHFFMRMDQLINRYPGYTSATPLPPAGTNPGAKAFSVTFASPAQAESALSQTKGFLMQPGWEMGVSKA